MMYWSVRAAVGDGRRSEGSRPAPRGAGRKPRRRDPTSIAEPGSRNLHLGQVRLKSFTTSITVASTWRLRTTVHPRYPRMTQLDGMVYDKPTPGAAPADSTTPQPLLFRRQRHQAIQYEFSFQNFYDSVSLLDAYVNFNFDPSFQVQLPLQDPFTYEFYRVHIWTCGPGGPSSATTTSQSPHRSDGQATSFEQRLEYAVGDVRHPARLLPAFDNLQDVEASSTSSRFTIGRKASFCGVQVGGSVDAGNENQSPVRPCADQQVAGGRRPSTAPVAATPLASVHGGHSGVLEHGSRHLGIAHGLLLAGGLSLFGAWQSGHESYSTGPARRDIRSRSTVGRAGRLHLDRRNHPRPHPPTHLHPLICDMPLRPRAGTHGPL